MLNECFEVGENSNEVSHRDDIVCLSRHQRSFDSSQQEGIKIMSRQKDYLGESLGPPYLTETKVGHNSLLLSPELHSTFWKT